MWKKYFLILVLVAAALAVKDTREQLGADGIDAMLSPQEVVRQRKYLYCVSHYPRCLFLLIRCIVKEKYDELSKILKIYALL